jgi:hypothetical protein
MTVHKSRFTDDESLVVLSQRGSTTNLLAPALETGALTEALQAATGKQFQISNLKFEMT